MHLYFVVYCIIVTICCVCVLFIAFVIFCEFEFIDLRLLLETILSSDLFVSRLYNMGFIRLLLDNPILAMDLFLWSLCFGKRMDVILI